MTWRHTVHTDMICKQKGTCKTPAGNFLPGRRKWDAVLTSGFMELQCDVGIKSKAEVIIENIQRKLQQGTKVELKLCGVRKKETKKKLV